MRIHVRRLLAALAVASLVSGVSTTPVTADPNCDVGELCLWGNTNYGGDFWDPSHHDLNWPFLGIENDDDSVKNRDVPAHLVYPNSSGGGTLLYCVDATEVEDDISGDRDNDGDSNFQLDVTTCPIGYRHP